MIYSDSSFSALQRVCTGTFRLLFFAYLSLALLHALLLLVLPLENKFSKSKYYTENDFSNRNCTRMVRLDAQHDLMMFVGDCD